MLRWATALTVLLLAAIVPAAGALEQVTVGAGSAQINAGTGSPSGVAGEVKSGTGLSFGESAVAVSSCGSANSSQTSATDNAGEAFTVSYDADVSSSYGSVVNCSPTSNEARGESTFHRDFSVSSNVAYTIEASRSGSPDAESSYSAEVAFTSVGGGDGAPGFVVGAPGDPCCGGSNTVSGVLTPGSYRVQVTTRCRSLPNGTCSGHAEMSLRIGDPAPAVLITQGPSGTTSSTSARFEFDTVTSSPPPGVFECKVDGQPSFSTCSSPQDLASLSDGEHTFSVRYDPAGSTPPSGPAVRTWTVDTTEPAVVFDSAPSGDGNPANATIAFHASEGSTFRCQLDGGPAFDCASPHTLLGLASGPHSFSVTAIDSAGNESTPGTVSWSVGPGAPISTACAAGATAGFGPVKLIARAENACFVDDRIDGENVRVSAGQVSMNGITLTPASGTRIIVAPALGGGTVRSDGPLTVIFGPPPRAGEDPIDFSLSRLELDNLGTAVTGIDKILNLGAGVLELVPKVKVLPEVRLRLGPENGGQTVVTMRVTLPAAIFSAFRDRREKVTLTFSPTLSNDLGVTLAGRVKGGNFFLFGQEVKSLDLGYDQATGSFDGNVSMGIGERRGGVLPLFNAGITIGQTDSTCELRRLSLAASDVNRPLGGSVNLQRFGGIFECIGAGDAAAVRLTATGGVSLGPKISIGGFNAEAVSIDGTAALTLPVDTSQPFKFAISGAGKVVDVPVSQQTVTFTSPSTVKLTGALDITGGGFGAQLTYGEQGTFVSSSAFNIEADGQASLFGVQRGANAVISSVGFAVCVGAPGERTGFGRAWGGELEAFTVCDVGPFRATAATARAAQAVAERRFTIGSRAGVAVVAVGGAGAPADLLFTAPGGSRVRPAMLAQDPATGTTFAVLTDPPTGTWTVSSARGSLGSVRVAEGLPPLRLRASVRGRGGTRTLRWKARGLGGQRLELVERAGGAARTLRSTRATSGRLRFTPDPALGSLRRTIEAVAYNGATPRSRRTVARFRAPAPVKPRKVRGLELRNRTLRWRGQRGIASYQLAVTLADGETRALRTRRARLKLGSLPKAGTVRVAIVAVNAVGDSGPVARAKVR